MKEITEKHGYMQGSVEGLADCDICRLCGFWRTDEIHKINQKLEDSATTETNSEALPKDL